MCLRVGLLLQDAPADITRGDISPPTLDVLDKPASQEVPVDKDYGTYVLNGYTSHDTLYDEEY
jgi:hypothetical protein